MEIALTNRASCREELLRGLEDFAREHNLAASVRQAVDLALEEHLTNVLRYAYEDDLTHEIRVRVDLDRGYLVVEVEDDGKAFNPLQIPEADTSAPLETRPIGGLGVHLIRRFMDDVDYRREGNKNVLRLRKRLAS